MPYTNLSDTRLYYEDSEEGKETIVFSHSLLFNLRMFDDQVNFLKPDYRCFRFDFRGQGKSEVTPDGYDLDTLTEDAAELIQKLDCNPCHFVGFSMGGMVALRLALRYPELLKSLVLIDTSSEPEPPEKKLRNKLMMWVAKHIGLQPVANQIMELYFGTAFTGDRNNEALIKLWKNHFLANTRIGVIKAAKGILYRGSITHRIKDINLPTLILVGEDDSLTPIENAEIMHKAISNSQLKVIPRAAHMSTVMEPDAVNEMLREFLGEVNSNP